MELTDKEIKEFWEWCGLTIDYSERWHCYYVYSPEGHELSSYEWLFDRWLEKLEEEPDPATALFRAIQEVRRANR